MAHHKRGRAANRRSCCKMCKAWKINGHGKNRLDAETIGSARNRLGARLDLSDALKMLAGD